MIIALVGCRVVTWSNFSSVKWIILVNYCVEFHRSFCCSINRAGWRCTRYYVARRVSNCIDLLKHTIEHPIKCSKHIARKKVVNISTYCKATYCKATLIQLWIVASYLESVHSSAGLSIAATLATNIRLHSIALFLRILDFLHRLLPSFA